MMRPFQNIVRLARRLRRSEEGVAAVEFALILPFLLALYVGSIEAAALFTVDKRVSSVSSTIGDLFSQWDADEGKITTTTNSLWTDYLNASSAIIFPYSTSGLKIVVSLVQVKSNGTTKVLWSKANAAGAAKVVNNAYPDPTLAAAKQMNIVARGGCVIAAEVSYDYVPVLGQMFKNPLHLSHTNYFMPRFGSNPPINLDTTSLAADACTKQT